MKNALINQTVLFKGKTYTASATPQEVPDDFPMDKASAPVAMTSIPTSEYDELRGLKAGKDADRETMAEENAALHAQAQQALTENHELRQKLADVERERNEAQQEAATARQAAQEATKPAAEGSSAPKAPIAPEKGAQTPPKR